jgi:hypothetical protein
MIPTSAPEASPPGPGKAGASGRGELGLLGSTVWGAIGFALVGTAAFSVWAFGGGWFRTHGGEGALYAAIAAAFVVLSGLFLHPLIRGPRRVARFYAAFGPAFVVYSVVWSGCWFWLKSGPGEWLGAAAGSAAFVGLAAWRLGSARGFWPALAVFFVLHTAGYFAGGKSMNLLLGLARAAAGPEERARWAALAKLSWGVSYGLGFGAGLGYAFAMFQARPSPSDSVRGAASGK